VKVFSQEGARRGPGEKRNRNQKVKSGIGVRKIWVILVLLAVILLLGYGLGKFDLLARKAAKVECLGQEELSAPVFSLPDLKGDRVDLFSFKGEVIIIEFWATWCGPCKEEIPVLNQLYKKYRDKGLVVVGVSLDRKEPQEVKKFLDQLQIEYINVIGDEEVLERYSQIAKLGPIRGIPATFLIDRKGRICQRFLGLTEKGVLEEALQPLL
jgi:thiol-disulfide isomerase/thioredoxin